MSSPVRAGTLAARFPVYQIDFAAVASGKRIATTKRRIRWRFGFTNVDALEAGQTGTACRGEEHDITIIWSVTSGKRQILCDGQEVHFSTNRSGVVDFSWPMRGNHTISVIAHASPPLSATPGFRQYDMFVDGQSFFLMPKVYELGLRGPVPSQARVPGFVDQSLQRALPPAEQEDEDLQRAIRESLEESKRHLSRSAYDSQPPSAAYQATAPAPVTVNGAAPASDLLDFGGAPAPTPPALPAPVSPPASSPGYGGPAPVNSAGSVAPTVSTIGYHGAPTVAANVPPDAPTVMTAPYPQISPAVSSPYGADAPSFNSAPQPMPAADSFGQPVPPADDPFAPKPPPPPTHNDIASAILGAYTSEPPPFTGAPVTPDQGAQTFQTLQLDNAPAEASASPGVQLSMNSIMEEEKKDEPQSEVDRALKNLVNFDDINAPAEQEMALTMKPKEEKQAKSNKSKAIPPRAVFGAATLEQIKDTAPTAPAKSPEGIMKPPPQLFSPDAVNAGALVVHGQGPPPVQRGFGVGAHPGAYGVPPMQYQQPGFQQTYQQPPPQYAYNNY